MAAPETLMKHEPFLSLDRILSSLPGRVLLVVLAAVVVAVVLAVIAPLILQPNRSAPLEVLRWTAAALVGLASGLAARRVFVGRTLALRLSAALAALLAGLIMLGLTTQGIAGVMLPERSAGALNRAWIGQFLIAAVIAWLALNAFRSAAAPRKRVSPAAQKRPAGASPAKPAARGVTSAARSSSARAAARPEKPQAQEKSRPAASKTGAGSRPLRLPFNPYINSHPRSAPLRTAPKSPAGDPRARREPAAAPAGSAAPRPAERRSPSVETPPTRAAAAPPRAPAPAARSGAPRPAVENRPPPAPQQPSDRLRRLADWNSGLQGWWRARLGRRTSPRPTSLPAAPAENAPRPAPAGRAAQSPAVRLVGSEEYRCPFCLELVEPNDPRGIVECRICHTRHHADCWEITGACQVPHYNG